MRAIDADALIADLEHDVAIDQDTLDYEELTEINRANIQFDKDCKQNTIDLLRNASTIEPEPCEDAVSRKWLLEAVEEGWIKFDTEEDYNRYIHLVRDIAPSVTPERKKGKWIERNPQNSDKCRLIECDQCGFAHIVGFNVPYEHWIENRNFCERCGSDMRGNHND